MIKCPKCKSSHGNDWSQCEGSCPMPGSPHYKADKDCSCQECVGACEQQPGWFAPGEAEKAAEYLGIPFDVFTKTHVIKDHVDNPYVGDAPYVYAPRKVNVDQDNGEEIRTHEDQRTGGFCVFLSRTKRCTIHPVKPYECRKTLGCDWKGGHRNEIEQMYLKAGAPLGMRPEDRVDERLAMRYRYTRR